MPCSYIKPLLTYYALYLDILPFRLRLIFRTYFLESFFFPSSNSTSSYASRSLSCQCLAWQALRYFRPLGRCIASLSNFSTSSLRSGLNSILYLSSRCVAYTASFIASLNSEFIRLLMLLTFLSTAVYKVQKCLSGIPASVITFRMLAVASAVLGLVEVVYPYSL